MKLRGFLENKIKLWLLILIAGIIVSGFSFKSVNAFPAVNYDSYDVKGKIVNLEVIEEETSEMYGKARFTLEISKATLRLKGKFHNEIPPIKSGDILKADSYYRYKYGEHINVSVAPSLYNPSEFKDGEMIRAGISYAGLDAILLSDPKHVDNTYYIYAMLFGSAVILITFLAFIMGHQLNWNVM